MKRRAADFAVLGGPRAFEVDLHVGQLYFPEWERYEAAMRGIVERQYYTSHGPLVQDLESRLERFFGVRNAVTVTSATFGLYLVALALGLEGKVLMPAFTFVGTAQAALFAGLDVEFCDVDRSSHHMTPETAQEAFTDGFGAVCAVNLWGGSADVAGLVAWASDRGLPTFFDSAHGAGVERPDGRLGRFGSAEVFSFHATKILSAGEGGCVCTDDDELAERVRNMRSSYGMRRTVQVPLTINGRMSEAQAALALISLEDLDARMSHNRSVFHAYRRALAEVPGLTVVEPSGVRSSNYQSVVVALDQDTYGMSRDALCSLLRAEGVRARRYFKPGVHRSPPFDTSYQRRLAALPVTDALCESVLQLPVGALCTVEDAERIAALIREAQRHSASLPAVAS